MSLTLKELTASSGVSTAHLGRIERGDRFPSAHTLRKIAKPLGFQENDLFTTAGYLSAKYVLVEELYPEYRDRKLDPRVAALLSQEPVEVQQAVIGILSTLKIIAKGIDG